ncbi:NAD-dependent epimerase/dehydratase family protein [Celeribacter baekdonensis]|uniref:Nucleoside-diphosphate sugar epimerase n=1 Tax=Celeribacter baekdonensis TaxID=875171 RepID=A0A2R4LXQ6_9RHOB|nr:SDR family oxidoreductase [Celeribacter baekdonensis]AVW89658.1 nucleoside-diphosphate sugar epimerase [Celeribacter baekdonensis]
MSRWQDKPVLVTGGTGFLGAFVARELVAQGLRPRVFDRKLNAETLDFVRGGLSQSCEGVAGDVTQHEDVARAMDGCGAVVHLAGLMTVDCKVDPLRAAQVNLIGSQTVMDLAIKNGAERLAYASSSAVYGSGEGILPNPETLYGVHKLAIEGMARCAWLDHGLPSVGFRPYIVYGPGESRGIAAGPSIALRAAALGQSATIQFSGPVGFVHVSDVARAFVAGLFDAWEGAQVYDLHGVSATVDGFISALRRAVPDAAVSGTGPRLKTPVLLQGGGHSDWFDALRVTSLEEGIAETLSHWRKTSEI